MLVILATQEAETKRIVIQSQPRQTVHKILSQKNPFTKNWAGGELTCNIIQPFESV
jgi:hypothetical protein